MFMEHCYTVVGVTTLYLDTWEVAVFVLGQAAGYPSEDHMVLLNPTRTI